MSKKQELMEIHIGVRDPEDVIRELRTDVEALCSMFTENYERDYPLISAKGWVIPDWVVVARGRAEVKKEREK